MDAEIKEKLLENAIKGELRELRFRLNRGKGVFGRSNYVADSTWGSWLHAENTLSQVLIRAGLSDGKE